MLRLNIRKEPPVKTDEAAFFKVIKAAFSQRRKVLSNSLSAGLGIDKAKASLILEKAGVAANARAEQLSLEDFAAIANQLNGGKAK